MKAEKWEIDHATTLVKMTDGRFFIIWAGAAFDPVNRLDELAEGELLADCEDAVKRLGIPCEVAVCDVGPFGDSVTLLMDAEDNYAEDARIDAAEYARDERTRGPGAR